MRPEKDRVKALLTEAVTLLCKNSITYQSEVEVEGLLGITVDKRDVFLVSLKELITKHELSGVQLGQPQQQPVAAQQYEQQQLTPTQYSPSLAKRKRRRKSAEGATTPKVAKKVTGGQVVGQAQVTMEASDPVVIEDDDGSNGTVEYGEQEGQEGAGDQEGQELFGDLTGAEQMLDTPNIDSKMGIVAQSQTSDDPANVKLEQFSQQQQHDDSYDDNFASEQKWSASFGMMQQDGGVATSAATYSMPQLSAAPQSTTQVGVL